MQPKNRVTTRNPVADWQEPYPPAFQIEDLEFDTDELANYPVPTKEDYKELERLQIREIASWLKECL